MINYGRLHIRVMWSQLNKKEGCLQKQEEKKKQKGWQIQVTEKQCQSETRSLNYKNLTTKRIVGGSLMVRWNQKTAPQEVTKTRLNKDDNKSRLNKNKTIMHK